MYKSQNQRKLWRERWLSCINELTSLELQRKSWLCKSNTNPHWSFIEFMCCYFDDLGIDRNYQRQLKAGWISKSEFDLIKPWHILLDSYNSPKNDDYDVEAILTDKQWLLILDEGLKVKKQLSKILSEEERLILFERIDFTKYL